jgi:hypothetical protein
MIDKIRIEVRKREHLKTMWAQAYTDEGVAIDELPTWSLDPFAGGVDLVSIPSCAEKQAFAPSIGLEKETSQMSCSYQLPCLSLYSPPQSLHHTMPLVVCIYDISLLAFLLLTTIFAYNLIRYNILHTHCIAPEAYREASEVEWIQYQDCLSKLQMEREWWRRVLWLMLPILLVVNITTVVARKEVRRKKLHQEALLLRPKS